MDKCLTTAEEELDHNRNGSKLFGLCVHYFKEVERDPHSEQKIALLRTACYLYGHKRFEDAGLPLKDLYPDVIDSILMGRLEDGSKGGVVGGLVTQACTKKTTNPEHYISHSFYNAVRKYYPALGAGHRKRTVRLQDPVAKGEEFTYLDRITAILAEDESLTAERTALLDRIWATLNGHQFKNSFPIIMHMLDGKKHLEIASIMDIPEGTVRSRLHYARNVLSALFSTEYTTLKSSAPCQSF